jgi:tetratricopeptide (TPR) repeat protein
LTLLTESNLGVFLNNRGRLREAEPLLKHVVEQRVEVESWYNLQLLNVAEIYARLLTKLDKLSDAETIFRAILNARRCLLSDTHHLTLVSMNDLAMLLERSNFLSEAEQLYRVAIDTRQRLLRENNLSLAILRHNLALLLKKKGSFSEARSLLESAYLFEKSSKQMTNARLAQFTFDLAEVELCTKDLKNAELHARETRKLIIEINPKGVNGSDSSGLIAMILLHKHQYKEAITFLLEAVGGNGPTDLLTRSERAILRICDLGYRYYRIIMMK